MSKQNLSMKELTQMINSVMGRNVLTEHQLNQIMVGARRVHDHGGMGAVLDYLMKVTQADVDPTQLRNFANQVKANPKMGMDILEGKKMPKNINKNIKRKPRRP